MLMLWKIKKYDEESDPQVGKCEQSSDIGNFSWDYMPYMLGNMKCSWILWSCTKMFALTSLFGLSGCQWNILCKVVCVGQGVWYW
jgi:hypothetical protein